MPERLAVFVNTDSLHSRGLDLALEARRGKDLRLRAAYGYQRTEDPATGAEISNSPRHLVKLDTALPLGSRLSGGLSLQYLSPRLTLLGGQYVEHDPRGPERDRARDLAAPRPVAGPPQPLRRRIGQDPGSEEHVQGLIPQDGRTFSVRAVWSF